VVANEAIVIGEEPDPVLPDRALGVVLEVREPVPCLDERRTFARVRPCDRGAVGGLRQVYRLTQWLDPFVRLGASLRAIGTNLTGSRAIPRPERDIHPMPRAGGETHDARRIETLFTPSGEQPCQPLNRLRRP